MHVVTVAWDQLINTNYAFLNSTKCKKYWKFRGRLSYEKNRFSFEMFARKPLENIAFELPLLTKLNIWKQNWLRCTHLKFFYWLLVAVGVRNFANIQFRSDFVFGTFFYTPCIDRNKRKQIYSSDLYWPIALTKIPSRIKQFVIMTQHLAEIYILALVHTRFRLIS